MLKHYLKIAIRNAQKNKVLSFAKLFGIIISFAVILFSIGYIYYEMSFDRFVPNSEKIYRLLTVAHTSNAETVYAVTNPRIAEVAEKEMPEIIDAVRIRHFGEAFVEYDGTGFLAGAILAADTNFFSFFGLPVIKARKNLFDSINHVAISESLALEHFGSVDNALNKTVMSWGMNFIITGVYPDFPKNFHLNNPIVVPMALEGMSNAGWFVLGFHTYFRLAPGDHKLEDISHKLGQTFHNYGTSTLNDFEVEESQRKYLEDWFRYYQLEPLTDVHFYDHTFNSITTANITYVYGALILSILVLCISSVNFINLSIANISTRYKDIGVLKATGAKNYEIVYGFFIESSIFWVVGFVLALIIYQTLGVWYAGYLNLNIHLTEVQLIIICVVTFVLLIVFNLLVNLLPLLRIANKRTVNLLYSKKTSRYGFSYKEAFILVQFVLSTLIILCSVFIHGQITHVLTADRGYDTSDIITLFIGKEFSEGKGEAFIKDLIKQDEIHSVTASGRYFGEYPDEVEVYRDMEGNKRRFRASILTVDSEFNKTFNFKMSEGRFFAEELERDSNSIILNRKAAEAYSEEGNILGNTLMLGNSAFNIIGVTEDFNFQSLYYEVEPLIMLSDNSKSIFYIKATEGNLDDALRIIQQKWNEHNVPSTIVYLLHEEILERKYDNDQKARKLLLLLSIVSLSISCVGLYAISYFTIVNKTKEFAIRKINGAKVFAITYEFSRRFIIIVITSFLISTPIAWYLVFQWLQNFAYKIELRWWVFALVGLLTVTIALLTILGQTWIASRKNPVEALRYE